MGADSLPVLGPTGRKCLEEGVRGIVLRSTVLFSVIVFVNPSPQQNCQFYFVLKFLNIVLKGDGLPEKCAHSVSGFSPGTTHPCSHHEAQENNDHQSLQRPPVP